MTTYMGHEQEIPSQVLPGYGNIGQTVAGEALLWAHRESFSRSESGLIHGGGLR
jgi:hypothetical protein